MIKDLHKRLQKEGQYWARNIVCSAELDDLRMRVSSNKCRGERIAQNSDLYSAIVALKFHHLLLDALPHFRLVRALGFYKSKSENWSLPWHQDRVIAVDEKQFIEGYGNWSQKSGKWHCEPPADVLKQMFFCRIYLDDCNVDSGAMDIALGSHEKGLVIGERTEDIASMYPIITCVAAAGDVLILPMLTIHKSRPAVVKNNRRVIRLDYSSVKLPSPLNWAYRA